MLVAQQVFRAGSVRARDAVLKVDDLCVGLRRRGTVMPLVRNVGLSVERGSFTAIIGESGSGKSLTCLAVMGLLGDEFLCSGAIEYEGAAREAAVPANLRAARLRMIFQDPAASLNPVRTIGSQLMETIRFRADRPGRSAAGSMAAHLLNEVGIDNPRKRLAQYPHELSGGMNQRVMIALALADDPVLLIADEPTTALDATTQQHILDLLQRLRRQKGLSMLFVTHDLEIMLDHADHVYVMHEGRVVESEEVRTLAAKETPHEQTANLLKAAGLRP